MSQQGDQIWIPNACGARYEIVYVTRRAGRRWAYVVRKSVRNWCMMRRDFPARAYATVTGDWAGTIPLAYNGKLLSGNASIGTPTLYLEQGCHLGTGGLATNAENPVGLAASMNGTAWVAASSSGDYATCIPWAMGTYNVTVTDAAGGEPGLRTFAVTITE